MSTRHTMLLSLAAMLSVACGVGAGAAQGRRVFEDDLVRFEYPDSWEAMPPASDGRFRIVTVGLKTSFHVAAVGVRTAPDPRGTDDVTGFSIFARDACGPRPLDRTELFWKPRVRGGYRSATHVIRNHENDLECLQTAMYVPHQENPTRPHLGQRLALVLYAHRSAMQKCPGLMSELCGGDVTAHLESLEGFNVIVRTLQFK